MKKLTIILTIISVLLLSLTTGVYAASNPKDIEVTLSNAPSIMKVGETVELTAVADKHGSSYIDMWDNANEVSSLFDPETETYISKAVFKALKPGIYTIRYTIQMTAGNSNTVFAGTAERTIEVISPATVIGARIQNLTVSPSYRADGSLSGYSAYGKIYTLWSDNSASLYGSIFFFFGPDEKSKDVSVTLNINNHVYSYLVTVIR